MGTAHVDMQQRAFEKTPWFAHAMSQNIPDAMCPSQGIEKYSYRNCKIVSCTEAHLNIDQHTSARINICVTIGLCLECCFAIRSVGCEAYSSYTCSAECFWFKTSEPGHGSIIWCLKTGQWLNTEQAAIQFGPVDAQFRVVMTTLWLTLDKSTLTTPLSPSEQSMLPFK